MSDDTSESDIELRLARDALERADELLAEDDLDGADELISEVSDILDFIKTWRGLRKQLNQISELSESGTDRDELLELLAEGTDRTVEGMQEAADNIEIPPPEEGEWSIVDDANIDWDEYD